MISKDVHTYCWWFQNPKQPPGMVKILINHGDKSSSLVVSRILSINSIRHPTASQRHTGGRFDFQCRSSETKLWHPLKKWVVGLHPGRLTWNLQIIHLERKMIFQTSIIMFHVNLQGFKYVWCSPLFGVFPKMVDFPNNYGFSLLKMMIFVGVFWGYTTI